MLRITIQEEPEAPMLRLGGRVAHIVAHGRRALAEIHNKTDAEFPAHTQMPKYFVEEARRQNQKDTRRGA